MTLKEQVQVFLDRIYQVQEARTIKFINSVNIQSNSSNKDYFKYSIAYYLVNYLKDFNGIYTDTITEEKLFSIIKFLQCFFGVYYPSNFTTSTTSSSISSDWILYDGMWNDVLHWDDYSFWND